MECHCCSVNGYTQVPLSDVKTYEMIIHNLILCLFTMYDRFRNAFTSLAAEFPRLGVDAERIVSQTELSGN